MTKYNLMYVYDITPKKTSSARIKRKFYYYLQKIIPFVKRATKSVIITSKEHEKTLDNFFMMFGEEVVVYKCEVNKIEILKSNTAANSKT